MVPRPLDSIAELAAISLTSAGTLTLRVATGPAPFVAEQLARKSKVVRAMHERVQLCQDAQTEVVLARQSLGVGRVCHILRVHGLGLGRANDTALTFDSVGRASLERLFPGITPEGHVQATLNANDGGLGWKSAAEVALPAHLGGLIAASPRIKSMIQAGSTAGLLPYDRLESRLDEILRVAEATFLAALDEVERVRAEDFLRKARSAASEAWVREMTGASDGDPPAPRVVSEAGDGPTEGEAGEEGGHVSYRRIGAPELQRELPRLLDVTKARRLDITLQQQGAWPQLDRFHELRDKNVSHKWLTHLDVKTGAVLTTADYVVNIQKRLGARVYTGEAACRLCGAHLDAQLEHGELCCTAEATRGHYACVRSLVDGLRLADPAVTTEPRGLTASMSRPADILTSAAVPGRRAALDVCVASPNAATALGDAAESAFRRKLRRYRQEIPELARAGIVYRPLVWTADGRPHPAVTRTLRYAAETAVTRNGEARFSGHAGSEVAA